MTRWQERKPMVFENLDKAVQEHIDSLKNSGKTRDFPTGAHRDSDEGKGRFDLIPSQMLFRLARHYEKGANKYGARNWELGMPISKYLDAAKRHLEKYQAGWNDEDHLAAALWNLAAITHHEEKLPHLQDLPDRSEDDFRWVIRKPGDA